MTTTIGVAAATMDGCSEAAFPCAISAGSNSRAVVHFLVVSEALGRRRRAVAKTFAFPFRSGLLARGRSPQSSSRRQIGAPAFALISFKSPNRERVERIVRAASSPETIREPEEVFLVDRVQRRSRRSLDDLVLEITLAAEFETGGTFRHHQGPRSIPARVSFENGMGEPTRSASPTTASSSRANPTDR